MSATLPQGLEALIAAPNDDQLRLVYADALTQLHDPRGELIAVQHQLQLRPNHPALRSREVELLRAVGGEALLGPGVELHWHLGFIREAVFGVPDLYERVAGSVLTSVEHVMRVMTSPSAALLERLRLRFVDFEVVVKELAALGPRPSLSVLRVGDFLEVDKDGVAEPQLDGVPGMALGHVGRLVALCPNLTELQIAGGDATLGPKLDVPRLRKLEVRIMGMSRADLEALIATRWPSLETLTLEISQDSEFREEFCSSPQVIRLFRSLGEHAPKLTQLGLPDFGAPREDEADRLGVCLQASPMMLKRLEALDVTSFVPLSKTSANALAASKESLRGLKTLRLRGDGQSLRRALAGCQVIEVR